MSRRKLNPEVDFDWDALFRYTNRLKKVRPKSKVTDKMIENPHQMMRWWAINGKNIKRYEHLYYTDKSIFVREKIIKFTKNMEILSYAALNEKKSSARKRAMSRFYHKVLLKWDN